MSLLLSPGPVRVPEEVLLEQARPMITHRSKGFTELYSNLCTRLKTYLNSEEAYVLTGSGTLANETNVLNCCRPKEKMLVLSNGEFGDRLCDFADVYGTLEKHTIPAGQGWDIAKAKPIIDKSDATVFGMVYNETGYGVKNHAKEIFQYAKKKGMMTIMDSVSGWPALPFDQKEFKVDFFGTASQKALGAPPGMGITSLSADAIERIESRDKIPSVYCDLRKHRKHYQKNQQTPNTPAVSIYYSLRKSLDIIDREGGIHKWHEKHKTISEYTQSRVKELGFKLIPEPGFESWSLTAFYCENADEVKKALQEKYRITIVGCKGELNGKGLRIAHMGNFQKEDIDFCLGALEKVVKK